jgi:hypothetical protein
VKKETDVMVDHKQQHDKLRTTKGVYSTQKHGRLESKLAETHRIKTYVASFSASPDNSSAPCGGWTARD